MIRYVYMPWGVQLETSSGLKRNNRFHFQGNVVKVDRI
jgi:hypothetical protein